MLISKKDLLAITGISYGQLYRWKREKLIPEEWFIKQSSYTGQETFFPREQILSRIRSIQELKDKYTLEELAKILSPEVADRTFGIAELEEIDEIEPGLIPVFAGAFGKENFTFPEIIYMAMVSQACEEGGLPREKVGEFTDNMKYALARLKTTGVILRIIKTANDWLGMLQPDQAQVMLDARMEETALIRMDEAAGRIKIKYKNRFRFQ
ncbi:MAG: DUF4004 family protein [Lachnospiraceae bacterium]|nr:DUF4004 family protein [Lachnospiraceae bacterium]